jgi:GT2 family glycosyltransferase
MKEIEVISATKHEAVGGGNCLMEKYQNKKQCSVYIEYYNTDALAKVYNRFICEENRDKIIVFCHDDCIIEDLFLKEKLNQAMQTYDIVGLAGIKDPITIKKPALWHLMGDRSQYSGAVAHFTGTDDNERFMTPFGTTPSRVIMLDGVFLAVNVEKCLETGVKFDESNPARFHYYDIDFCLNANKAGLKLTTYPIFCSHRSHGLTKPDEEFYKGQKWFINKWT